MVSAWQRSHEAFDRVQRNITAFCRKRFEHLIEFAWSNFHLEDADKSFEDGGQQWMVFMPYFIFRWRPEGKTTLPSGDVTIAHAYLRQYGHQLSDLEQQIVECGLTQPISFYQIVSVRPGVDMTVQELFTGETATVLERRASEIVHRGDILYAQMAIIPDMVMMAYSSPVIIPPRYKVAIVELRQWILKIERRKRMTVAMVLKHEDTIRGLFLRIWDLLFSPPRVVNTDGESIQIHTLRYEVGSAQVAFDALYSLALGATKEDLLHGATYDGEGNLLKVNFPWLKTGNRIHKSWETTVLAHIDIEGRNLVAEANSEKRAKKLRSKIEERLGVAAIFKESEIKNLNLEQTAASDDKKMPELPEDPAEIELIRAALQKEVDDWASQKIPALRGLTPKQAVKDPDGRELVEALMEGYAATLESKFPPQVRPDISVLRSKLKLDKPDGRKPKR